MLSLGAFTNKDLQNLKVVLEMAARNRMSMVDALNQVSRKLEENDHEIRRRPGRRHAKVHKNIKRKPCPACGNMMRIENKGKNEHVWNCLSTKYKAGCSYSEYIGVINDGK